MGDFGERIAHLAADAFQFGGALFRGPGRPALQSKENESGQRYEEESDERQRERPGESSPRFKRVRLHNRMAPKKYRPPRPMDVKGGCSPQNIFLSADLVTEL